MSTSAIATYVAGQAGRRARRTVRRWLPWAVLVLFVGPLLLVVLVAGVTSETQSQNGASVGNLSCSVGGATAARNVAATLDGVPLRPDQVANAQTIVAVGRQRAVPAFGWVVAVAAAMQESTLTNLHSGDRDSLGLFQMRPSMGWGTPAQLTDPVYAAGKFYDELAAVPGWQSMSVTQAAQSVEKSAFPDAYATKAAAATALVQSPVVLGASCVPVGGVRGSALQQRVVAAAMSQLGIPYAWGGGDWYGATRGIDYGANTVGFDCSGLTGFAWYQGSGGAVAMDTFTGSQMDATVSVDKSQIEAGDLLFFPDHVGLYDGRGGMVQAPHTGAFVEVTPNIMSNPYWMSRLLKIGRPKAFLAMPSASQSATPAAATSSPVAAWAALPPRREDDDA